MDYLQATKTVSERKKFSYDEAKQIGDTLDICGDTFDHDRHEAIAWAEDKDREPGTVVGELRRGYLWNHELLRPAQVRVAR